MTDKFSCHMTHTCDSMSTALEEQFNVSVATLKV